MCRNAVCFDRVLCPLGYCQHVLQTFFLTKLSFQLLTVKRCLLNKGTKSGWTLTGNGQVCLFPETQWREGRHQNTLQTWLCVYITQGVSHTWTLLFSARANRTSNCEVPKRGLHLGSQRDILMSSGWLQRGEKAMHGDKPHCFLLWTRKNMFWARAPKMNRT